MLFTIKEYGLSIEEIAEDIKQHQLFPLTLEEVKNQICLVPYLALGKCPEAVIAIRSSKITYSTFEDIPNKNINQYTQFIRATKKEMLTICDLYVKLMDNQKKEYLERLKNDK